MSTGINVTKPIKILDEGVLLTADVNQIDFTGGVTATTSGNNVTVNVPAAGITVGTTPVTSGTDGRVFFQAGGVVQQDGAFNWDNNNKRLGIGANATSPSSALFIRTNTLVANDIVTLQNGQYGNEIFRVRDNVTASASTIGSIFIGARMYSSGAPNTNQFDIGGYGLGSSYGDFAGNSVWVNNAGNIGDGLGSSVVSVSSNFYVNLQTTKKYKFEAVTGNFGIGNVGSLGARLDVRAQGALSTDIAFRVRNSVDNDNLIESAGNGLIKFRTGTERIEINTSASDYKMSLYKFGVEMTRLSTYSSYFCVGGSGQYLGVGTSGPSHLLDINTIGSQKQIVTRFGNEFNSTTQSDVSLKFTTLYCGGGFGGNPLAYLTVGNNGGVGVNNNAKSYFKFELLKNNTLAERASITSQSNLLLQAPTEDTNDIGVIYIPNGTAPTVALAGGGKLYVEGGALKYIGSSGTITTIAPA